MIDARAPGRRIPDRAVTAGQDLEVSAEVQAAYLTAKRVHTGDLRDAEWSPVGRQLAAADPDRSRLALAEVVGARLARDLAGPALAGRPTRPLRLARRRQVLRRYRGGSRTGPATSPWPRHGSPRCCTTAAPRS
jgi:hypothetical protein